MEFILISAQKGAILIFQFQRDFSSLSAIMYMGYF